METYDKNEQQIIDFLKSARELKPNSAVLSRVLQELHLQKAREAIADHASPRRSALAWFFEWFSPRYIFATALVLLVVLSGVKLVTPTHVAVASEIAALEIAGDEIGGDIEHADVTAGEASLYELDFIGGDKK